MITMFSNGSIHSSCVQKCCMSSFKYQEYVQLSTHLARRMQWEILHQSVIDAYPLSWYPYIIAYKQYDCV